MLIYVGLTRQRYQSDTHTKPKDIEPNMGPTHVWPGTNTVEHHATLWGQTLRLHIHSPRCHSISLNTSCVYRGSHITGKLSVEGADEAQLSLFTLLPVLLVDTCRRFRCVEQNAAVSICSPISHIIPYIHTYIHL